MSIQLNKTRIFASALLIFSMFFSIPTFANAANDVNMSEIDQMVAAINESGLPLHVKNQLLRDMDVIRTEYEKVPDVMNELLVSN